jgi:predicted nucleotidyltransferase
MEAKLKEFVERLKNAARGNLRAAVLFGSAVTGEFVTEHSDLNILCVLDQATLGELEQLQDTLAWWMKQGHVAPLVFTMEELLRSADVYAIEFLDMKQRHRMLYGEDFFAGFEIPLALHRLQVERELRTNWLRLRQAILAAPPSNAALARIMLGSVSSFCALFRHALLAIGAPVPHSKREAVDGIAALTGGNATGFHSILDLREGKRKQRDIDMEGTLASYMEFVEVITNEVDQRFAAR